MASSSPTQNLVADTWVKATWEEFMALADNPAYEKAKFYYDRGYMRIEMPPIGFRRGRQNSVASKVISLFATLKNIRIVEVTNTSFKKLGLDEFQPDLACYIGTGLKIPSETDSSVDLDEYDLPTLVVEIAASSVNEDLGRKRLLYERVGIQEYWVVDVKARQITAFSIADGRSGEIQESRVLPGLAVALVEEALQRSQTQDDGEINRWLLQSFSQS
jgi:Uma2 family endonuclease